MRHPGLVALALLLLAASAQAQNADTVETDPIRCWWRTSTGAVRIGEPFTVTLTCAVLDTDAVQVVPDESRLAHAVIQMAPFEVVTGVHPPDIRSGQRRFLQYEYTVRALTSDMIGQDVPLPNLALNYRVNSRIAGNAAIEGRDLSYLLPPLSVRVMSSVPADATDIRDTPNVAFARIESLRYRAGAFDIAALALVAVGSILTLVALIGLVRRPAAAGAPGERLLGERAILGAARHELAAAQRGETAEWSDALLDRAMAATRLVAAVAAGRRISQQPVARGAESGEGRLIVNRTMPRAGSVAVSSAVTAGELTHQAARLPPDTPPARRHRLEELATALDTFASAQYTRMKTRDHSALAAAAAAADAAASALRTERLWPRQELRRIITRAPTPEHS